MQRAFFGNTVRAAVFAVGGWPGVSRPNCGVAGATRGLGRFLPDHSAVVHSRPAARDRASACHWPRGTGARVLISTAGLSPSGTLSREIAIECCQNQRLQVLAE